MPEFDIIQRYFQQKSRHNNMVRTGIGDDAAVLIPPVDDDMVVAVDTLVNGVHFPTNTAAFDIGYKALAVNLSDLAAMGAVPRWMTLALTLPQADEAWLEGFSNGLFSLADEFDVCLVGGDTTQGPLTISVQLGGSVKQGKALLRSGAQPGDHILVTGNLGDAARAIQLLEQKQPVQETYLLKLNRPLPRVAAGQALTGLANACIDISDGLYADLSHITAASGVGAEVELGALPLSVELQEEDLPLEDKYRLALSGGDDYELCFTVSDRQLETVQHKLNSLGVACSKIGRISETSAVVFRTPQGGEMTPDGLGYQHFS